MRSTTLSSAFLLSASAPLVLAISGSGKSTRYWDCCKPSCAWPDKASVNQPVYTCDKNNQFLSDFSTKSGCESGGTAYTCAGQEPWAVNSLISYGFAATAINGQTEADWCCGCYALTFTSGKSKGKVMLIQSVNTGSDLADNQFDLQIPGGGTGIFDGCTSQFGGIAGAQYGGISNRSECASMPAALQPGCYWRFDWFNNADNPTFNFQQIQCPDALVNKTGCRRADDATFPKYTTPSVTTWNTPVPTETAASYAQCDSITWDVAKACPSGFTCSRITDYYYQCVQGTASTSAAAQVSAIVSSAKSSTVATSSKASSAASSSTSKAQVTSTTSVVKTSSSSAATTAAPTGSVAAWAQCNASTWTTPAKCQDGLTCVFINDYYSQCQPTSS